MWGGGPDSKLWKICGRWEILGRPTSNPGMPEGDRSEKSVLPVSLPMPNRVWAIVEAMKAEYLDLNDAGKTLGKK